MIRAILIGCRSKNKPCSSTSVQQGLSYSGPLNIVILLVAFKTVCLLPEHPDYREPVQQATQHLAVVPAKLLKVFGTEFGKGMLYRIAPKIFQRVEFGSINQKKYVIPFHLWPATSFCTGLGSEFRDQFQIKNTIHRICRNRWGRSSTTKG